MVEIVGLVGLNIWMWRMSHFVHKILGFIDHGAVNFSDADI